MKEDERISEVRQLLYDYVKSPSLRHIRDMHSVNKLAQDIVRRIDRGNSIWKKWDGHREVLLKSALACWIPIEDMQDFLNAMPGPRLTLTDVEQRRRAFEGEQYFEFPNEDLQSSCLAIYQREKAEGTELPAIVSLLRDHVEREEERIRSEQKERYQKVREEERIAREQRLMSGADCNWTQLQNSPHWHCRANGRTYRLSPTKDKMFRLYRVSTVAGDEDGNLIGKYQRRGDATKVVAEMAYKPEPKR